MSKSVGMGVAPLLIGTTSATETDETTSVDFGRLTTSTFEDLPDEQEDLEPALMGLAETIHTESAKIEWETLEELRGESSDVSTATRQLQFIIQILQNNDLASYLDEAWVAGFRDRISVVTRYLPILGSYNNLYESAKTLDEAGNQVAEVAAEKYEEFSFAIIAFSLEVGLFYVGAPYQMAWRGTRFVSNRTLLRLSRYVDNRLIALVMSELHYNIRKRVYTGISSENIDSILDYSMYLVDEFEELQQYAVEEEIKDEESGEAYLESTDLDVDLYHLIRYQFLQQQLNDTLNENKIEGKITLSEEDLPDLETENNSSNSTATDSDEDDSGLPFGF